MRRFRLIEHTADIGLVAYGGTLAEAFANAACGMFSVMADLRTIREAGSRTVVVRADDVEGLLFEWLNHLLYLFDTEMILLKRFDIISLDERRLKAMCYGEKYDPRHHHLKIGVKAATYHKLKVDKEKKQVRVIFDV